MRLIDADALWEKMYKYSDNEGAKMPYGDNDSLIHRDSACFLIEEAPTIQSEPHWIPVTERLPKEKGLFLVSVKNDHQRAYSKTCWYYGNGKWFARQDVTAWMPLPEPYKGG